MQWGTLSGAIPGWYVYEPARQKKVSQSLPMWGVNRADNYVDVSGPGPNGSYLKITDVELVGATPQDAQLEAAAMKNSTIYWVGVTRSSSTTCIRQSSANTAVCVCVAQQRRRRSKQRQTRPTTM